MGRPARRAAAVDAGDKPAREHVLDCATELFAARGYHGVSLRDVTTVAQVGMATVYYHFKDKAGLHAVVLRRAVTHCVDLLAAAVPEQGLPEQRLRNFFDACLAIVGADTAQWRIVQQEMTRSDAQGRSELAAAVFARPCERLRGVLRELSGGRLDDAMLDFHARAGIGLACGLSALPSGPCLLIRAPLPAERQALAETLTSYVVAAANSGPASAMP